MSNRVICIFAKPPCPGKTKQRLAAAIGDQAAAALSAAMLQDIAAECTKVKNAECILFHPPESSPDDFCGLLLRCDEYTPQQGTDLGDRMAHAFELLFSRFENAQVVLIGSDCVALSTQVLEDAFAALENHQIVLQPASDGGYVLVGQAALCPDMFKSVDWSTEHVMQQTLSQLKSNNISYGLLPESFDVDELEDLVKLQNFIASNPRPATEKALISIDLKYK
jgi:uncharacterized protein